MRHALKSFLPRSLYGRAALILILPIVAIQLIVSIAFIQRHFEGVTRQLSRGVIQEVELIRQVIDGAGERQAALQGAEKVARAFDMQVAAQSGTMAAADAAVWYDLTGGAVIDNLRAGLAGVISVDLVSERGTVWLALETGAGPLRLGIDRARLSASNPHQLFVIMALASVLMTLIAYAFLRNQLRPIARLAAAAEAFGKGQVVRYKPRGANEVRAAGAAFLDMRARIERAIETRTMMLSGISHDLRTPLTRLKLGLSMLPEDEEVEQLLRDVAEMEGMVDEFLSFARGDATEELEVADPVAIAARVVENAVRGGGHVVLEDSSTGQGGLTRLRPQAVARALENLVGNGLRHGKSVRVTVQISDRQVLFAVEDDGPGIPVERREAALAPFARLDDARNRDHAKGVGLGLAIAADIARSHGGSLILGQSADLGGLRAELRLAR